jgi:osmotically-inducible protein OsmY
MDARLKPFGKQPTKATMENKEIVTAASAVLAKSAVPELRKLRVDESSNELQLHGRVRSYYHKQLAQEAVLPLAGQLRVVNHVDVGNHAEVGQE